MRWIVLLLIAFLTVALLTAPRALQAIGDFLVAGDPLRPSDAAIAISGDGRERVRTASALVTGGHARWLILSGGPPGQPGAAAELVRYAREHQVADAHMLVDATATSTVENAYGSARVMRTHGLRTAIVVTSPYHMRRTIIVFRAIFQPQGLAVRAFPALDSFFEVREWWTRRRDRELVLREYAKLAAYLVGFR
ncbi:MAG: YdcF family protein [Armatimonadota bacterium]